MDTVNTAPGRSRISTSPVLARQQPPYLVRAATFKSPKRRARRPPIRYTLELPNIPGGLRRARNRPLLLRYVLHSA